MSLMTSMSTGQPNDGYLEMLQNIADVDVNTDYYMESCSEMPKYYKVKSSCSLLWVFLHVKSGTHDYSAEIMIAIY